MSDTNHNGIKSERLYTSLKEIIRLNDPVKGIQNTSVSPADLLDELITHILHTIPNELFQLSQKKDELLFDRSLSRLEQLCAYLQEEFKTKGTVPFTMLRISELCFDPLKYFKVFELAKFVNALEKCCLVKSPLEFGDSNESDGGDGSGNVCRDTYEVVSLEKIPWLGSDEDQGKDRDQCQSQGANGKENMDMGEFIKKIDGIMNLNYNLRVLDGEDEMENNGKVDIDGDIAGFINDDDVRFEEYYGDDIEEDMDDGLDQDFTGKTENQIMEEGVFDEIDDGDEDDEDYVVSSEDEDDDIDDEEDTEDGEGDKEEEEQKLEAQQEKEGKDVHEELGNTDMHKNEDLNEDLPLTPRKRRTFTSDDSLTLGTPTAVEGNMGNDKESDNTHEDATIDDTSTTPKKPKIDLPQGDHSTNNAANDGSIDKVRTDVTENVTGTPKELT